MVVYPAALALIAVWVLVIAKDADRGVTVVLATLPFGMFAAVDAGGLSMLIAHLLGALMLLLYLLRRAARMIGPIPLSLPSIFILCFSMYSVFSAIVFVRLFTGEFLVFPMSVDTEGIRTSNEYFTTVKPVAPSNSNIAQSGYILLSALLFVVFYDIARRRGVFLVEAGLAWAGGLNILLATIDFMGADAILAIVRTADYSLANEQTVLGLPRVIGGYPEASAFGSASSILFSYFATSYLIGARGRDFALAGGNFICTVMAFSSTGFAALFVALFLIACHRRQFVGKGTSRVFAHFLIIGVSIIILCLSVAAVVTPLFDRSGDILNELFFQKAVSQSGLERSAWARYGFNAFLETWGLGAGAGSLRANGLASVLLGSVGVLGTFLYLAFVWTSFGPCELPRRSNAMRVFVSARVAALTLISGRLLSATTPDPGLFLMAFAAIAAVQRSASIARHGIDAGNSELTNRLEIFHGSEPSNK